MKRFVCPKCRQESIPLKDKYLASAWMTIRCANCGARLCGHPVFMALIYFVYFWIVATCVFWAWYHREWAPLAWMLVLWALLDFISIRFMPLKVLRSKDG